MPAFSILWKTCRNSITASSTKKLRADYLASGVQGELVAELFGNSQFFVES
jgi:hypothetical protein